MISRARARLEGGRLGAITETSRGRDLLALGFLFVLPLVMYLPMTIAGSPPMPGDNLSQNFPLRVLVGEIIRSGKLPGWDPFIWSGTPLLAGWNAGAMFPGTWLFAVLPSITAWIINFLAVPVLAAFGMYVLLRLLQCRAFPSCLGALVFTYTGFLSGQIVHIGLAQGTACMPWILVALEGLARSKTVKENVNYGVLLAVAVGLNILAADPRAVSSAAIAAGIYLLACCWRLRSASLSFLARAIVGAIVGAGLAAVQWAPGLSFLHSSQRSQDAYAFFGVGSLPFSHVLSQMLVPFLFGANGNYGLPPYQGNYNLPELSIGVGLFVLVAVMHYLPSVLGSAATWLVPPRGRARRGVSGTRRLGVWFWLGIVGAVLTLGTTTPLGHVLVHIPFFAGERLQNRNAVLFDLALAVLVGFYIDDRFTPSAACVTPRVPTSAPRIERALKTGLRALPPIAAIALVLAAFVAPLRVERYLGVPYLVSSMFSTYRGYLIATIVLASLIALFVVFEGRLRHDAARVFLVVLVTCDIGVYIAEGDYDSVPSAALTPNSASAQLARYTGSDGRFAIYNPAQELNLASNTTLVRVGVTDLNILQKTQSVQGYGSIVNEIYENATNTHSYESLNVARLSGVSFNTLDLRTLFSLPLYFGESLADNAPIPLSNGQVLTTDGGLETPPQPPSLPPYAAPPQGVSIVAPATYTVPRPAALASVEVVLENPSGANPPSLSIGARDRSGRFHSFAVPVKGDIAKLALPSRLSIASFSIAAPERTHAQAEAVVITYAARSERFVLNGSLQGELPYPHWRYLGLLAPLVGYQNTETSGYAWLQPASDKTPDAGHRTTGTVVVQSSPIVSQRMVVDSPGNALLARSEAYAPGWTARITPIVASGTRTLRFHRFGLVQAVDLPAGNYVVTWTYAPRGVIVGLVISFLSTFLILLVPAGVYAVGRRRARNKQRSDTGIAAA